MPPSLLHRLYNTAGAAACQARPGPVYRIVIDTGGGLCYDSFHDINAKEAMNMELSGMYQALGISPAVYRYGEDVLAGLKARFEAVDAVAEYNQAKVLKAMQKNRVSAACFAATTGYGYDDVGRDTLEKVYADVFHTEAALVRPQITCGTHALTVAVLQSHNFDKEKTRYDEKDHCDSHGFHDACGCSLRSGFRCRNGFRSRSGFRRGFCF